MGLWKNEYRVGMGTLGVSVAVRKSIRLWGISSNTEYSSLEECSQRKHILKRECGRRFSRDIALGCNRALRPGECKRSAC